MTSRTFLILAALAVWIPVGVKLAERGFNRALPPDLATISCPKDKARHASTTFGDARVLFVCIPDSHADKPKLLRCVGENGFDVMPNMHCEDSASLFFLHASDGSIRAHGRLDDEQRGAAQVIAVFGVNPWPRGREDADDPPLWPDAQEILPAGFQPERLVYCHEQASRTFGDGYATCLLRARSASLYWQFHVTLKTAPGQDVDEEDYKRELRFIRKYLAQLVTDPA